MTGENESNFWLGRMLMEHKRSSTSHKSWWSRQKKYSEAQKIKRIADDLEQEERNRLDEERFKTFQQREVGRVHSVYLVLCCTNKLKFRQSSEPNNKRSSQLFLSV